MNPSDRTDQRITIGFWLAALYNIGAFAVFGKLLTNDYLASLDPQVFSKFGWVGILLWGLAYAAVARTYRHVPALLHVFFAEKMIYAGMWLYGLVRHGARLPGIFEQDFLTGLLLSIYGLGDLVSGLFFLWVARRFGHAARAP